LAKSFSVALKRSSDSSVPASLAASRNFSTWDFFFTAMSWSPIPDDHWVPLEHERDRFFNVYIDETSQTEFRYLIIGGLAVSLSHTAQLEADIIAARANTVVPSIQPDGTPRVMKWQKLNAYNFDAYKKVVDTVFNFRRAHKLPLSKDVAVHCVGVDTSVKSLRHTGAGDMGLGFDKEFYFLCCVVLLRRYQQALFMLYPDRHDPTTEHLARPAIS
jgi:hypothetical protein